MTDDTPLWLAIGLVTDPKSHASYPTKLVLEQNQTDGEYRTRPVGDVVDL